MIDENDNKETPTGDNYQSCPSCSLPHPLTDTICSFCDTPLPGKVTLAEKMNRKVLQMQWRYQKKTKRGKAKDSLKKGGGKLISLLVGILLVVAGGWLTMGAVGGSSFSGGLFGMVFLSYGLYALWHTLRR